MAHTAIYTEKGIIFSLNRCYFKNDLEKLFILYSKPDNRKVWKTHLFKDIAYQFNGIHNREGLVLSYSSLLLKKESVTGVSFFNWSAPCLSFLRLREYISNSLVTVVIL